MNMNVTVEHIVPKFMEVSQRLHGLHQSVLGPTLLNLSQILTPSSANGLAMFTVDELKTKLGFKKVAQFE